MPFQKQLCGNLPTSVWRDCRHLKVEPEAKSGVGLILGPPVTPPARCAQVVNAMQVRTYSEWVIDGDYDWPPKCPVCQENLEESQKETVRLGCLRKLLLTAASLNS